MKPKESMLYKCPYCSLITKYACSIKKHVKGQHPDKCKDGALPRTHDLPTVADYNSIPLADTITSRKSVENPENKFKTSIETNVEIAGRKRKLSGTSLDSPYESKLARQSDKGIETTDEISLNESTGEVETNALSEEMKLPDKTPKASKKTKSNAYGAGRSPGKCVTPAKAVQSNNRLAEIVGNKCPHCDFSCKRVSALNFHININHPKIKEEPETGETDKVSGNVKTVSSSKVQKACSPKSSKAVRGKGRKSGKYLSPLKKMPVKEQKREDESEVDSDIEEEFDDDDVDSDYNPDKDSGSDNENEPTKITAKYKCLYCAKVFKEENHIQTHVNGKHASLSRKAIDDIANEAIDEEKVITYLCPFCDFISKHKTAVIRHVTQHHKIAKQYAQDTVKCYEILDISKKEQAIPIISNKTVVIIQANTLQEPRAEFKDSKNQFSESLDMASEMDDTGDANDISMDSKSGILNNELDSYGSDIHDNDDLESESGNKFCDSKDEDSDSVERVILRNFKCPYCGALKKYKKWIIKHVEKYHSEEQDFNAEDIECIRETSFQKREDEVDSDCFQYRCPYCNLKSQYRCSVTRHIKRYHPGKKITFPKKSASKDNKQRKSKSDFELIKAKKSPTYFKCSYCTFISQSTRGIRQHALLMHREQTETRAEKVESINTGLLQTQYMCPYCSMTSDLRRNVYIHVKEHHPQYAEFKIKDVLQESVSENVDSKHSLGSNVDVETDVKEAIEMEGASHYKCLYCDFVCQSKQGVSHHGSMKHPDMPEQILEGINAIEISKCKPKNMYSCPYCDLSSPWKTSISRHVENRHSEKTDFNRDDILSEMVLTVAGNEKQKEQQYFKCPYCHYLSKSKGGVSIHSKYTHPKQKAPSKVEMVTVQAGDQEFVNIFKCPMCEFNSPWRGTVRIHLKNHHREIDISSVSIQCEQVIPDKEFRKNIFYCPYCSNVNKSKRSIIAHIRMVHPEQREHVIRKRTTTGNSDTVKHLKVTETMNVYPKEDSLRGYTYKCHVCNAAYSLQKSLLYHIRMNHRDILEVFRTLDNAVDIVHSHQPGNCDDRGLFKFGRSRKGVQYRCPYCDLRCSWEKTLVAHLRSRHANRVASSRTLEDLVETICRNAEQSVKQEASDITCTTCNVCFNSAGGLRRHRKIKHRFDFRLSRARYSCRLCGAGFLAYRSLVQHQLCQHRGRGVHCGQCDLRFASRYSLGVHQRVVHRSQELSCKYPGCTYRCKWGITMKVHYSSQHSSQADASIRCEVCSLTLSSSRQLQHHINVEHLRHNVFARPRYRKREYQCKVCHVVFDLQQVRDRHVQEAHPEETKMCEQCGIIFTTERLLSRHVRTHHGTDNMETDLYTQCSICHKAVFRKSLNNHMLMKHPDSLVCHCAICSSPDSYRRAVISCYTCSRGFCSKIYLTAHNTTCHAPRIKCKFCDLNFATNLERNVHAHEVHKEDAAEASIAAVGNKVEPMVLEETADPDMHVLRIGEDQSAQYLPKLSGSSLSAVIKELRVISGNDSSELPFKCVLCGRCFAKSKYIYLHIKRKHVRDEDKRYRCKVCGLGFVGVNGFRKHSRAHSGVRPYKCKICSKTFKAPASLYEHMHLHDNAKNFRCEICLRYFQQRGAINAHVVRHDLIRPFKCMFCDKGYTTRGELSRHLQRYNKTANKMKEDHSHTCHICLETFSHFPVLLRHIEMHNPEKPFHCAVCDTLFSSYLSMYNHKVKNSHFLSSEIDNGNDTEEKTFRKIPMRNNVKSAVSSILPEEEKPQILMNSQSDDRKPIEVVIESYPSASTSESTEIVVAKSLSELSELPGYTEYYELKGVEQETLQQKEDEIMKDMLDADGDLLANFNNKQPQQQQETVVEVWQTVDDNEVTIQVKDDGVVPEYTIEQEIPCSTTTTAEVPNNLEDLATIIARNTNTDEALTAYQTEDGSVIYVCMPNDVAETVGEEGNTARRLSQLLKKSKRITLKK